MVRACRPCGALHLKTRCDSVDRAGIERILLTQALAVAIIGEVAIGGVHEVR